MSPRTSRLLAACLLFLSCLAADAAPPQRWTFVDLGTFGASSSAADVNNRGDVVGGSTLSPQVFHGFLWQNGVMHDVNPPGDSVSTIWRITERGTMLGFVNQVPHLWKDGAVTQLPLDFGLGINRFDHIVGYRNVFVGGFFSFAPRAVLLRDGVVHDLGILPGGDGSVAEDINDRGVIVGNSRFMPGSRVVHAFVYEDGVMRDLGTLGGMESFADAINNRGVIVGTSQEPNGRYVAVVWDRGGMRRLVDGNSRAVDINDRGQIVVLATVNGLSGSFLYDDGSLTHLDSLPEVQASGVTRLEATAINDRGWVVGFASRPGEESRAFLLIPR